MLDQLIGDRAAARAVGWRFDMSAVGDVDGERGVTWVVPCALARLWLASEELDGVRAVEVRARVQGDELVLDLAIGLAPSGAAESAAGFEPFLGALGTYSGQSPSANNGQTGLPGAGGNAGVDRLVPEVAAGGRLALGTVSASELTLGARVPLTARAGSAEAPQPSGPSGMILLAEDNPDIAELVVAVLGMPRPGREAGDQVFVVTDGAQAISGMRAHAGQLDLVFMDLHMPGVSGCEAAKRGRRNGFTAPIVGFSAERAARGQLTAYACGCSHYLGKPFAIPELVALVDRLTVHGGNGCRTMGPAPSRR